MLVELGGLFVKCVDHHEAGGDELRGSNHPPESVSQDGPTKTLAPQTCIDRKAGQQDRRHLSGAAPADALGKFVTNEAVSCERVVAHDHIFIRPAPNEGPGDSPCLCPSRMLSQPAVEFGLTRIQGVESVARGVQWLGSKDHGSG